MWNRNKPSQNKKQSQNPLPHQNFSSRQNLQNLQNQVPPTFSPNWTNSQDSLKTANKAIKVPIHALIRLSLVPYSNVNLAIEAATRIMRVIESEPYEYDSNTYSLSFTVLRDGNEYRILLLSSNVDIKAEQNGFTGMVNSLVNTLNLMARVTHDEQSIFFEWVGEDVLSS